MPFTCAYSVQDQANGLNLFLTKNNVGSLLISIMVHFFLKMNFIFFWGAQ